MKRMAVACAVFLSVLLLCSCVSMSESDYDKAIRDAYDEGYRAAEQELSESCYQAGYDDGYRQSMKDAGEVSQDSYHAGYSDGFYAGQVDVADQIALQYELWDSEDIKSWLEEGNMTIDEFLDYYGEIREAIFAYLY
jgi:hypothetical protein